MGTLGGRGQAGTLVTIRHALIDLAEKHWSAIARVCARSLGRKKIQGFLPPPRDRNSILGWGVYGVVWETGDPRFVVKISADPTEGPSIAQIRSNKTLWKNSGCVYFHKVWRIPGVTVNVPGHGECLVWVILREELTCATRACRASVCKKIDELGCSAQDLSIERGALLFGYTQALPSYIDSEIEFVQDIQKLRGTEGEPIANFMASAYEREGLVFSDMHAGNVGHRCHNLSAFGVPRKKTLVIRDVGDPFGSFVRAEGEYPKIPVLK
jgi:hypothetical protein